jgi:hypothetical protein
VPETFLIKHSFRKGDVLTILLFNIASVYGIMRDKTNQDGLKLNCALQLLVYVDDNNILGGSIYTIKKNTEALVVASKESVIEENADKTMYMVMFRDQNARQSHNIEIYNCSFERAEQFKYLGTTLKNQNSIQEEIESRLKSGNACYHSVHNLLSSSLLPKNLKIKIYR